MNNTLYEKLISNISESLWNTLKEEYHVLRTFDNVVDDIYNDFISERGRIYGLRFTGWKLNIDTSECIKEDENTESDLFSIYVNWQKDFSTDILATTDIRGIDIKLDEHMVIINANVIQGFNIKTIKSLFHYEFVHVKHMYGYKDKNIIMDDKNMSSDISNTFDINEEQFAFIKKVLYMFSPTEIQARINQQYRLVIDMSNDEIYDISKDTNVVQSLIEYHKKTNLYDLTILDFVELDRNNIVINKTDYILLLNIIGFYLHQKHILKNDIKESAIKKIISNNTCTDIDIANAKKVRSNVRHLMKDYIDKLSKQICYALNQKQYQEFVLDKENNWEK